MRKKIIVFLMFLWLIAFARIFIPEAKEEGLDIVTTFSNEKFMYTDSILKAEGSMGNKYYTDDERKELLEQIAKNVGLTEGYDIEVERTENQTTGTLIKTAKNAVTTIKMVTIETVKTQNLMILKNYLYINIEISNSLESAVYYKEKVKSIYENMGIVADITLNLVGSIEGGLNNTEKNNITDEIMKKLKAKVVTGNRDDSIYTVYGYCGKIEEYVVFGSTKTNINVAITYDEQNNLTRVYMATPIISTEY